MIILDYIDLQDANGTPAYTLFLTNFVNSGNNTGIGYIIDGASSVNMSTTTSATGYVFGEEWILITPQSNTWTTQSEGSNTWLLQN
jgi:hypothetical protein